MDSLERFKIADADMALILASSIPFFGVTAPVVTLMDARMEGFFLGAIAVAGLATIVSKVMFGWQHVVARLVLAAAGLWGVVGTGHQEYAVIIPGGIGTLAQWLWIVGVVGLVYARSRCLEAHSLELAKGGINADFPNRGN